MAGGVLTVHEPKVPPPSCIQPHEAARVHMSRSVPSDADLSLGTTGSSFEIERTEPIVPFCAEP